MWIPLSFNKWGKYGSKEGEGTNRVAETYALTYVKQVVEGICSYDAGAQTLCSVTNLDGWEWAGGGFRREGTYVYLWPLHAEAWQKSTLL